MSMKILLLKDVPRVGNKGQILEVSDSYGLNAFVNKGLAKIATVGDAKIIAKKESEKKAKKENELDKNIEVFKRLEKEVFLFNKKVDAKGHLYAKLSKLEIIDMIFEKEKISISEKQINMPEINGLGSYAAEVTVNTKKYKLVVKVV
jgi:large subunit ribosomal protein L9